MENKLKTLISNLIESRIHQKGIEKTASIETSLFNCMDPIKISKMRGVKLDRTYDLLYNLSSYINLDNKNNIVVEYNKVFKDFSVGTAINFYHKDQEIAKEFSKESLGLLKDEKNGFYGMFNIFKNAIKLSSMSKEDLKEYNSMWFQKLYCTFPDFKKSYDNLVQDILLERKKEDLKYLEGSNFIYKDIESIDNLNFSRDVRDFLRDLNTIDKISLLFYVDDILKNISSIGLTYDVDKLESNIDYFLAVSVYSDASGIESFIKEQYYSFDPISIDDLKKEINESHKEDNELSSL